MQQLSELSVIHFSFLVLAEMQSHEISIEIERKTLVGHGFLDDVFKFICT